MLNKFKIGSCKFSVELNIYRDNTCIKLCAFHFKLDLATLPIYIELNLQYLLVCVPKVQ